jgi:hypothetical protein
MTTRRVFVINDHLGRTRVTTQIGQYIQCPNYGMGHCHRQFVSLENLFKHLPECKHDDAAG